MPHLLWNEGAPKNLYRVPEKDSYEIGDEIQCLADANPSATYYWRNLDTLEVWDDNRLLATDRLVGTQRMQCHADNIIDGIPYQADYFFNFTVNRMYTSTQLTMQRWLSFWMNSTKAVLFEVINILFLRLAHDNDEVRCDRFDAILWSPRATRSARLYALNPNGTTDIRSSILSRRSIRLSAWLP